MSGGTGGSQPTECHQSIGLIGTKEGVVEAITKLVGSDVTNAILWMADGSDHKCIDKFTLYKVMKWAIDRAD
jgi:hypothetical protein